MNALSTPETPYTAPNWRMVGLIALSIALLGNPWTQAAYFDGLLAQSWTPGGALELAIAGGFLAGILMFGLTGGLSVALAGVEDHKGNTNKKRTLWGLAALLVTTALVIFPLILNAVSFSMASSAIEKVQTAERNLNFQVAIKDELKTVTRSLATVKQNRVFIYSIQTATVSPEKMMGILAATDVLGSDHPSVQFVLANGMARDADVTAIQATLFEQARLGNGRANQALMSLAFAAPTAARAAK